ncbi:hypothetical protein, partial [Pseudomonas aeruginosa]
LMEQNLRRALSISNGELGILWSSPISLVTWALVVVMLLLPLVTALQVLRLLLVLFLAEPCFRYWRKRAG